MTSPKEHNNNNDIFPIRASDSSTNTNTRAVKFLFRKEVDWSLLNYGFTIPKATIDTFISNIDGDVSRGGSLRLNLIIDGESYPATLSNVGFSDDNRTQIQVRYSTKSQVATLLREIFWASYDFFNARKQFGTNLTQPEGKEYVDVICASFGVFGLICHPLINTPSIQPSEKFTIKDAISKVLSAASKPMTAYEIYDRIIALGLYTFGAQNPANVVRNIILRACDNSPYSKTYRDVKPCFHIEINDDGKRVYSILDSNQINDTQVHEVSTEEPSIACSTKIEPEKQQELANPMSSFLSGIVDLEEGKSGIRKILEAHFQTLCGYSNINILWEAAQNELLMFLNDNAINTATDLWEFICRVFEKDFTLSNPHIWQIMPNYPMNVRGIVVNIARQYGGVVTREQIDSYFARIKIGTPTNHVLVSRGELLFCNKSILIPADRLYLTDERCMFISNALNELFSIENAPYIVLRDIRDDWFAHLPELTTNAVWTPMLMQEVLRVRPNIGYRVILPNVRGQAYDTLGAAIVPNHSEAHTFADIVHRYCYAKYNLPHNITAENLRLELRDAGMLERNELIWNMHKALKDYRFAFDSEKINVKILER